MKKQDIISVLYELHKITGFRVSIHDVNFEEIAAYPPEMLPICKKVHSLNGEYEKCAQCDREAFLKVEKKRETVIYKCRFGLTETVSPLYNFGVLTGYLMMGQISDDKTAPSDIIDSLIAIGIPRGEAELSVKDMTVLSEELIHSYMKIMTICAQYLTLSNAMPGIKPSIAESAKMFIYQNIDKKITIKDICDEVGCSKTTLIASYKKEFGMTVNTAITKVKLEEAKKLLSAQIMSINEVALATGFCDQAYFSKVFSAEYGISPSEYKKETAK